ncbi:MAG: DUF4952 domain-containing protein [Symploca sp. SIO2E6]|nr:DUF4952 domain-containing protein [Symploca sp. SIO2E6]
MRKAIVILTVMLLCVSCHSLTKKVTHHTCGDFLAIWEEKPAQLQFTECKKVKLPPGKGLTASYVVKGSDAAEVEKILQGKFGMTPLKFACCGWEPVVGDENNFSGKGNYTDKDGWSFEITMVSKRPY